MVCKKCKVHGAKYRICKKFRSPVWANAPNSAFWAQIRAGKGAARYGNNRRCAQEVFGVDPVPLASAGQVSSAKIW